MELSFREAVWQDAEALIEIYNEAFRPDFERHGQCPAYGRTKDEMEVSILRFPKTLACLDGKIVGAVSGQMVDFGVYELGCLCVLPAYQGKGIGTALFHRFLEECCGWKCVTLITPADNEEVIRFCTRSCAMTPAGREISGDVEVMRLQRLADGCS